jgi:hypothetical protein
MCGRCRARNRASDQRRQLGYGVTVSPKPVACEAAHCVAINGRCFRLVSALGTDSRPPIARSTVSSGLGHYARA